MYVRMSWGSLRPGGWDEYRRHHTERVVPESKGVQGLHRRQLLRITENPDEGISLSLWDTLDNLRNYERSETRRELPKKWSICIGESTGSTTSRSPTANNNHSPAQ